MSGDKRGRRTHNTMIAAQVALTVLLLAAAGAAAKGFLRVLHVDLGYDPQRVLMVVIPLHGESHTSLARTLRIHRPTSRKRRSPARSRSRHRRQQCHSAIQRQRCPHRLSRPPRTRLYRNSHELHRPRIFFAAPHSARAGPHVGPRRNDARRGLRRHQSSDGAPVLAKWRRHRSLVSHSRLRSADARSFRTRRQRLAASHRHRRRFAQRRLARSDSSRHLRAVLDPHVVVHAHPRKNSRRAALDRARRAQANRKS